VDEFFPPHVRVIAEPGRYYTSKAFTLACNVIARRTVDDKLNGGASSYMLYMNDGVYGNFSSIIFDHQHPVPRVLRTQLRADGYRYASKPASVVDSGYTSAEDEAHDYVRANKQPIVYSLWGPTCDGIDCISAHWQSRDLLDVGDWLYFDDMGAYTKCSATRFNGFTDKHETIYVCSEPAATMLLDM